MALSPPPLPRARLSTPSCPGSDMGNLAAPHPPFRERQAEWDTLTQPPWGRPRPPGRQCTLALQALPTPGGNNIGETQLCEVTLGGLKSLPGGRGHDSKTQALLGSPLRTCPLQPGHRSPSFVFRLLFQGHCHLQVSKQARAPILPRLGSLSLPAGRLGTAWARVPAARIPTRGGCPCPSQVCSGCGCANGRAVRLRAQWREQDAAGYVTWGSAFCDGATAGVTGCAQGMEGLAGATGDTRHLHTPEEQKRPQGPAPGLTLNLRLLAQER